MLVEYVINNYLSGPATQSTNFIGNTFSAFNIMFQRQLRRH